MRAESSSPGPVGNVYDKYGTRNPIARWMMGRFLSAVTELYGLARPRTVLEVGCGEGLLAAHLLEQGPVERMVLTDRELSRLTPALRARIATEAAPGGPSLEATVADATALPFADGSFDLVVCCEVLEHLQDPELALSELARVARGYVLLSTPREPLWRLLNVARGAYLGALGNTPGHVQHWSRRGLRRLVERQFTVDQERLPVPWTVLLARRTVQS